MVASLILGLLHFHRKNVSECWLLGGIYTLAITVLLNFLSRIQFVIEGVANWMLIFLLLDSVLWLIAFYLAVFIARLTTSGKTR